MNNIVFQLNNTIITNSYINKKFQINYVTNIRMLSSSGIIKNVVSGVKLGCCCLLLHSWPAAVSYQLVSLPLPLPTFVVLASYFGLIWVYLPIDLLNFIMFLDSNIIIFDLIICRIHEQDYNFEIGIQIILRRLIQFIYKFWKKLY